MFWGLRNSFCIQPSQRYYPHVMLPLASNSGLLIVSMVLLTVTTVNGFVVVVVTD